MEKEDISDLKFENNPNQYIYKGENIKKEKSFKSNYSNSSSVETQYDLTDNSQQKNDTTQLRKDNESMNEVNTLINYNLSRKSEKIDNQQVSNGNNNLKKYSIPENDNINSSNKIDDISEQNNNNEQIINEQNNIEHINNEQINNEENDNKENNNEQSSIKDLNKNKESISNSDESNKDKDSSIGSISSSVVYSYSLNTKILTPKSASAVSYQSSLKETNASVLSNIDTAPSAITTSLESTPISTTPKNKTPYYSNSPISTSTITPSIKTFHNKIFDVKKENNILFRSGSSPSILKTEQNAKSINTPSESSLKLESRPSDSPSKSSPIANNKSSLNRIRKKEVIKELMESERLYVSDLQMLIENCFNPLEAVSWLPLNEKCLLIRNIQELFAFQQEFLKEMELSVKDLKEKINESPESYTEEEMDTIMNECVKNISGCFIRRKKKFKVYSEFCSLHQEAINIFREYERKPEMILFIRDFNGKTHSRLHLQDFLIKPVQRICKYPLLLKELIHYSDENCEEVNGLKEALAVMSEVAREIDHVKWLIERVQRTDKFIDRLDIQDQFKYVIMERYGDMILSTGLEVIMEKERVNYRGVFLFRKHMFVVKPKRSRYYRVKMHLILDEFYFQAYPDYNAFRLVQKNTGVIIDFFAFSTVESKVWIELMETLVEPLDDIAEKNKIFYVRAKNSYEYHFTRFTNELKLLNNNIYQRNTNLRRAASSSFVNPNLTTIRPIDPNVKTIRKDINTFDKGESVDSVDSNSVKPTNSQDMDSQSTEFITFTTPTPKINPIVTSTSLIEKKGDAKTNVDSIQKSSSIPKTSTSTAQRNSLNQITNLRKQQLHNISSLNSFKNRPYQNSTTTGTSSTTLSSTMDTEISSNCSEMLYLESIPMEHELVISEPGVMLDGTNTLTTSKRLVSEPESIKTPATPKKLDILSDTINKFDNPSNSPVLPPKYKLIDSKFYDVYTYLFTNNDVQKIFSNLMYRTHEFDHLLYHKKTTRSRSNSCPRERYLFKSSGRREREKIGNNLSMTTIDDRNNYKSDNRSSLYIPFNSSSNNNYSDARSIKSSHSSVNLHHLSNEETISPPPPNRFSHTRKGGSISSKKSFTGPSTDDASIHSSNSIKNLKRHTINIFKSNQQLEPIRSYVAESQIVVTDSMSNRCYSSLSDKMIDQDITFYFENMPDTENQDLTIDNTNNKCNSSINNNNNNNSNNSINNKNKPPSLDTLNLQDQSYNFNHKDLSSHRKTISVMDSNTLNNLQKMCNNDDDPNKLDNTTADDSHDDSSLVEEYTPTSSNNNLQYSNYVQNRHSIAVEPPKLESSTRTYGKVKSKKDKKVLFNNIKKIFSSSSRSSSSRHSSSSSSSSSVNSNKEKRSSFFLPKYYFSESTLAERITNSIQSPSIKTTLRRFTKSDFDIISQSPILHTKSPLAGSDTIDNKMYNSPPSAKEIIDEPYLVSTPIVSHNIVSHSDSLFEDEDDDDYSSSINSMNSMDHLNDQEPESEIIPPRNLHSADMNNINSHTIPLSMDVNNNDIPSSKISPLYKNRNTVDVGSLTNTKSNESFTINNKNFINNNRNNNNKYNDNLNNNNNNNNNTKPIHMNESCAANTSYISNQSSSLHNHSFISEKSNVSINSNKTANSSSSSVVKKFYLDQKDIVIPPPDKKLNSTSSNESLKKVQSKKTAPSQSPEVLDNVIIYEQNSFYSISNSNSLSSINGKNNHDSTDNNNTNETSEPINLNIVEETKLNENEIDDANNQNTLVEKEKSTNNTIDNRFTSAASNSSTNPNTNRLIHASSNSSLSSSQSNINNSTSTTPTSSRSQLRKNKTISLKFNLKKIF